MNDVSTHPGYHDGKDDVLKRPLHRRAGARSAAHSRGGHLLHRRADAGRRQGHEGPASGRRTLDEHLRHCVTGAVAQGGEAEADRLVTKASRAIERLVKS